MIYPAANDCFLKTQEITRGERESVLLVYRIILIISEVHIHVLYQVRRAVFHDRMKHREES